jgi:hypothetical protein
MSPHQPSLTSPEWHWSEWHSLFGDILHAHGPLMPCHITNIGVATFLHIWRHVSHSLMDDLLV